MNRVIRMAPSLARITTLPQPILFSAPTTCPRINATMPGQPKSISTGPQTARPECQTRTWFSCGSLPSPLPTSAFSKNPTQHRPSSPTSLLHQNLPSIHRLSGIDSDFLPPTGPPLWHLKPQSAREYNTRLDPKLHPWSPLHGPHSFSHRSWHSSCSGKTAAEARNPSINFEFAGTTSCCRCSSGPESRPASAFLAGSFMEYRVDLNSILLCEGQKYGVACDKS